MNNPVTVDRVIQAAEEDSLTGFCLACGEDSSPWEPDARSCECPSCGEPQVYGADEIILSSLFTKGSK